MVLPRALLHPIEALVHFVHQRLNQQAILVGQHRQEVAECRVGRQPHQSVQLALPLFALLTCDLDDGGLRVDGGKVFEQLAGVAAHDQFLLLIQQGQHLAALLQLLAERFHQ